MNRLAFRMCFLFSLLASSLLPAEEGEKAGGAVRPLVLLTNDDGINSPGIKALMKELPKVADVVVVAPATNNSGVSQSLTYRGDLKVYKREVPEELKDLPRKPVALYAVEGTPATCVLLGLSNFTRGRPFDMVISGINPGSNIGADGNLSGTVGAARMGVDMGVAALAVSSSAGMKNMPHVAQSLAKLLGQVFSVGAEKGVLLNVNYPGGGPEKWNGAAVTGVGAGKYQIAYRQLTEEERKASEEKNKEAEGAVPQPDEGALLFRARFGRSEEEPAEGTARHAIANGKISVTSIPSLSLKADVAQKRTADSRKKLAGLAFFK